MFEWAWTKLVRMTKRRLVSKRFWLTGAVLVPTLFGLILSDTSMPIFFAAYVLWYAYEVYDD